MNGNPGLWYNGWSWEERCASLPLQREAIRDGVIAAPATCSICDVTPEPGSPNPVWLHDENYAEPLAAYHVCRSCHCILHRRFDQPQAWRNLVGRHGRGDRWFEQLSMDPDSRFRPFAETYPSGVPAEHANT